MSESEGEDKKARGLVSLRLLASEVDALMSAWGVSINLQTGEIECYPEDDFGDWDGPPREQYYEPPWQPVDTVDTDREWRIMRDFAYSRENAEHRERLANILNGSKPFRRMRDAVYLLGIQDDWFTYRHARIVEYVREWLSFQRVPYADDVRE